MQKLKNSVTIPTLNKRGKEVESGEIMMERSISRGIKEELHGIVINEVWKAWDRVSKSTKPTDGTISNIELKVNTDGILHINFNEVGREFTVKTKAGADNSLTIIHFDDQEVMMLRIESQQLYEQAEERVIANG